MREEGFNPCHPLVLWEQGDVLVDGHLRLEAAKRARIRRVPVVRSAFEDQEDAVSYAVRHVAMRRLLSCDDALRTLAPSSGSGAIAARWYAKASLLKRREKVEAALNGGRRRRRGVDLSKELVG